MASASRRLLVPNQRRLGAGHRPGKWQFADPFTTGSKDGITDGGSKWWNSGFAYSGRWSVTIDDVDIGLIGRLVHPGDGVAVEVRLLDDPILGGNFPASDDAGSEYCGTLKL